MSSGLGIILFSFYLSRSLASASRLITLLVAFTFQPSRLISVVQYFSSFLRSLSTSFVILLTIPLFSSVSTLHPP